MLPPSPSRAICNSYRITSHTDSWLHQKRHTNQTQHKRDRGILTTKHFIGTPVITFKGSRAIVETNVMVMTVSKTLELGATTHARFYDRMENTTDGRWGILHRAAIYDSSNLSDHDPILAL